MLSGWPLVIKRLVVGYPVPPTSHAFNEAVEILPTHTLRGMRKAAADTPSPQKAIEPLRREVFPEPECNGGDDVMAGHLCAVPRVLIGNGPLQFVPKTFR